MRSRRWVVKLLVYAHTCSRSQICKLALYNFGSPSMFRHPHLEIWPVHYSLHGTDIIMMREEFGPLESPAAAVAVDCNDPCQP